MSAPLVYVSSVLLAVTFGWSGVVKVLRPRAWWSALDAYGFSPLLRGLAWGLVPAVELALVIDILFIGFAKEAGAVSLAVLAVFCLAILRAHTRHGDRVPCGCFGGTRSTDFRLLLARNALLMVPAAVLAAAGRPIDALAVQVEPIPLLLLVTGLAAIGWTAFEVARAFRGARH